MALLLAKWIRCLSLCLLLVAGSAFAQSYSVEDLKVALVGQFIKNIDWPDDSKRQLVIVVPQDRRMLDTLSVLQGEVINNKTLDVQFAPQLEDLKGADLVYLSKDVAGNLTNVLGLMRGNGTLVVTENSQTLHNIMINIVDTADTDQGKLRLSFQINRPNILFENLSIKPDLILHGGTELDVASLYRETEKAMQALRGENIATQRQLDTQQQELSERRAQLQDMQQNYQQLVEDFEQNQAQLDRQKSELADTTLRLKQANNDILTARQTSEDLLAEAESRLNTAESQLATAESNVYEQIQVLQTLEKQIEQKNALLNEKESALTSASQALQERDEVVESQAQLIDRQYLIIISIAVTLTVFIVSAFAIAKLFKRNKAINRELKYTVTTLKDTQAQLIESEKLASLGQLVAGVAHEINTPIGVAVTSSSVIGEDAKKQLNKLDTETLKKSELRQFLTQLIDTDQLIQSSLERCVRLIQNFKQISADQIVAENRDIRLKDYIDDVMNTQSVFLKQNNVAWSISGDNPRQCLDPGLLNQVFSNLVNNAIAHAFMDTDDPEISIEVEHQQEQDIVVFRDNGSGMEEAVCDKIFDPFFTTQRGQGGTGLGMNIVYNLITSKLGGTIRTNSQVGEGTTFTIALPARSEAPA